MGGEEDTVGREGAEAGPAEDAVPRRLHGPDCGEERDGDCAGEGSREEPGTQDAAATKPASCLDRRHSEEASPQKTHDPGNRSQ